MELRRGATADSNDEFKHHEVRAFAAADVLEPKERCRCDDQHMDADPDHEQPRSVPVRSRHADQEAKDLQADYRAKDDPEVLQSSASGVLAGQHGRLARLIVFEFRLRRRIDLF